MFTNTTIIYTYIYKTKKIKYKTLFKRNKLCKFL